MRTIQLKTIANGEVYLKDHQININDKSGRMNEALFHILPVVFLILGFYHLFDALSSEAKLSLVINFIAAVIFLAIPAHLLLPNLKRTNKNEIPVSEIKRVRMRKILGELFVDFELKDNSIRRVYNLNKRSDWDILREYLTEKKIPHSGSKKGNK